MNKDFLDFVESKISTEGSYQLNNAVNEFYNTRASKPKLEKAASYLQGTRKYNIVKAHITGNLTIERNPNYKEPSWGETHPVADRIRTAAIGSGFSLLVGIVLWLLASQKQLQVENQQNKRLDSLTYLIKMIQVNQKDSSKLK
jgi:hypothetical protein